MATFNVNNVSNIEANATKGSSCSVIVRVSAVLKRTVGDSD